MNARILCRLLVVSTLAIVTSVAASAEEVANQRTQQVLTGVGARGVFDPSVTEDPETQRLWMSYSSFEASTHSDSGVVLRIAYSDDGEAWHDAGAIQGFTEVLAGPLQSSAVGEVEIETASPATWQNEASSLIYDVRAPREERWKLFWHQTLWVNGAPRYASYSWIALKMADSPENLAQAKPIKVFTGYMAKKAGESSAEPAFSPIPEPPAIQLDKKDPQLGACMFGQPAALSTHDALYLALDCAWLGTRPQLHTVLLRCAAPDCVVTDAASWTVVGRLTEPSDGRQLAEQYEGFGGTALVAKNGQYFLIATPLASGGRYDGCYVYRFEDLASGELERGRRGELRVAGTVQGIPDTHHGACAAHARLKGGILLSQIVRTASPRVMQIRQSGVQLP